MVTTIYSQREYLLTYRPIIKTGAYGKIDIYYNAEKNTLEADVSGLRGRVTLPVCGFPEQLIKKRNSIMRFFSSSYCIPEKDCSGLYCRVKVTPSLKGGGGGFSSQDTLPMYPGYALGSIIHKHDFMLPLMKKKT